MLKRLTKWDWIAITIMVVGAVLRLYHLFIIPLDEPFRLGGLFYEFSRQIASNNFAFPETIPYYSAGGIPFAYPPLSFYVQAVIIQLFDPSLFITVNLIPPFVTLLSLPAFYWMARQYTTDIHLALAGLFAFALMPPAFTNQIEAAGLAESFGILALIFYLGILFRWKKDPNLKDSILAGIALGACVFSSPGSAYGAALFSIVFFIWICYKGMKTRSWKPIGMLVLVGILGLIISAPYWLTVMCNHGIDIYITPFIGQHKSDISTQQIEQILSFQPAGAYFGFIWNWLIFAGIILAILKRHYMIFVMFIIFWLIPREGVWLVSIPAALLAGMGLVYILLPLFNKAFHASSGSRPPLAPGILGVTLVIITFANALFTVGVFITDSAWYISRDQIESLENFQDEIPENGSVIIVGNTALAEWAPALLQREVLNIEYGLEWQPDELEKVKAINAALEEHDITGMMEAIDAYTGDQQVYLIVSPNDLNILQGSMPKNAAFVLVASTPALDLNILKIK